MAAADKASCRGFQLPLLLGNPRPRAGDLRHQTQAGGLGWQGWHHSEPNICPSASTPGHRPGLTSQWDFQTLSLVAMSHPELFAGPGMWLGSSEQTLEQNVFIY